MRVAFARYPEYGLIQFAPRRRRLFPWRARLRLCTRYSWRFLRTGDEGYLAAAELALRGRQMALLAWSLSRTVGQVNEAMVALGGSLAFAVAGMKKHLDAVAEQQRRAEPRHERWS